MDYCIRLTSIVVCCCVCTAQGSHPSTPVSSPASPPVVVYAPAHHTEQTESSFVPAGAVSSSIGSVEIPLQSSGSPASQHDVTHILVDIESQLSHLPVDERSERFLSMQTLSTLSSVAQQFLNVASALNQTASTQAQSTSTVQETVGTLGQQVESVLNGQQTATQALSNRQTVTAAVTALTTGGVQCIGWVISLAFILTLIGLSAQGK